MGRDEPLRTEKVPTGHGVHMCVPFVPFGQPLNCTTYDCGVSYLRTAVVDTPVCVWFVFCTALPFESVNVATGNKRGDVSCMLKGDCHVHIVRMVPCSVAVPLTDS
jgi:hypothetical protein